MTKLLHTNKSLSDFDVKKVMRIELPYQYSDPYGRNVIFDGYSAFMKKLRTLENTWGFSQPVMATSYAKDKHLAGELYIFLTNEDDELFVRLMMSYTYTIAVMWPTSVKFTCYEFTNS